MLHCSNATELYIGMRTDVERNAYERVATDARSPKRIATYEAAPGQSYELRNCNHNVVGSRSIDLRWATANVLHFFAATEDAAVLTRYNRNAERFLTAGQFVGAYGAKAMPGILACVARLNEHPNTRRAVVSLGGLDEGENYNIPRCMTCFHFLTTRDDLDLLVYQRSLSLAVMPYDCILLCNILNFAAWAIRRPVGSLRWTIGSLHTENPVEPNCQKRRNVGVLLPLEVLFSPSMCMEALKDPALLPTPFSSWLQSDVEVRT